MTTLLLDVLRERYPDGELTSHAGHHANTSPGRRSGARVREDAGPGRPRSEGWARLETEGSDTPAKKGIRDGEALAFAVVGEGGGAEFVVDLAEGGGVR